MAMVMAYGPPLRRTICIYVYLTTPKNETMS